jgi:hypothetical protein
MDQNPVFRKMMVSWYDSEPACYIFIVFMVFILLFGITGLTVALDIPEYSDYIWVPTVLIVFCTYMIFSMIFRLLRLYAD